MMRECGFPAGAGEEVAALIDAARRAGALGAKLTGAGGGGAIFALARPGDEQRLVDALRDRARALGLARSEAFVAPLSRAGLLVDGSAR